jgi:hypothetical protein
VTFSSTSEIREPCVWHTAGRIYERAPGTAHQPPQEPGCVRPDNDQIRSNWRADLLKRYVIGSYVVEISLAPRFWDDGTPRFSVTWRTPDGTVTTPARLPLEVIHKFDRCRAEAMRELLRVRG